METISAKYYKNIIEVVRQMPEFIFCFKTRPNYVPAFLLELIREYEIKNYEIVESVDFQEWLSSLGALITEYSTIGLEAMIFDIPVHILNLSGWTDPVGYECSGAVDVVQDSSELYTALLTSIENPKRLAQQRAEFVRYALTYTDGTAAKHTAQVISKLLAKHKINKR